MASVLRDSDHPVEALRDDSFTRALDPKGFWRVDKEKEPELRDTVLTLAAFRDLKDTIAQYAGDRERGIEGFCAMNDGDGWQFPETLCLADLRLGHDDRAKKPQPVRSRLGPRLLDWQLEQTIDQSWAECEMHTRNVLGDEGWARLMSELGRVEPVYEQTEGLATAADKPDVPYASEAQPTLFPSDNSDARETRGTIPGPRK